MRALPSALGRAIWGLPVVAPFVAHLFYGAVLPLPALWLTAAAALLLTAALTRPGLRDDLLGLSGLLPVGALFLVTLAVGVWSITPGVGGTHPLWDWSGQPTGAAAIDRSAAALELIKLLGLASFFGLGCLLGARAQRARTAFTMLLAIGGVWALIALVLFLGGDMTRTWGRLAGGFYTPNSAGTVLGMLTVLAVAWTATQWRRSEGAVPADRLSALAPSLAALLLFAAALLLTASRAAIGATLAALLVFALWDALQGGRAKPLRAIAAGALLIIGAGIYAAGRTLFLQRFEQVGVDAEGRAVIVRAHWQAFLDSPLTGHGLGSYPLVNNQLTTQSTFFEMSSTIVMHNAPAQWLEEAGLIGAVPMFLTIGLILGLTVWRTLKRRSDRRLLIGLTAASVVAVLHSLADVSLNTPSIAALWSLILGLGFAASQASSRR